MRFVKMSEQNQPEIQLFLRVSQQVFPFFISNSQAQEKLIKELAEDQTELIGMEEAEQLVGLISYQQATQTLVITNFQVTTKFLHKKTSVNYWLGQIEKLAKLKRAFSLELTIELLNQRVVKSLLAADFNLSSETHNGKFTKKLKYRTAIVLAGGGARGAYQIGAWRALKELGVDYQLITGTSVGALNGGLMLQGDMAAAETMWNEIDTGKILSFPNMTPNNGFTMTQMVKDIQRFALSAVSHQGVSTAPLQKLITDVLDEEKIRQNNKELLICTTQLPSFKEVVISLQETPTGEFAKWLLASSSFFPAMAAAKITDTYYVDGGYRNNIPIDVALKQGATELIVIDVKGPGITKQTHIPEAVPLLKVASPWSLGTVLLFDGNRSKWNQQLGYLETLKTFGRYLGHWYTFEHEITDRALREWHDRLFKNIFQQFTPAEKELFKKSFIIEELLKKMRNLYHDRVTTATISLYVLECVGKVLGVSPTVLYTVPTMEVVIHEALKSDWLSLNQESEKMLLSLQEWLMLYADESVLPTEKRQIVFIYQKLLESPDDPLLIRVARIVPHLYLVAKTLVWLTKEQLGP